MSMKGAVARIFGGRDVAALPDSELEAIAAREAERTAALEELGRRRQAKAAAGRAEAEERAAREKAAEVATLRGEMEAAGQAIAASETELIEDLARAAFRLHRAGAAFRRRAEVGASLSQLTGETHVHPSEPPLPSFLDGRDSIGRRLAARFVELVGETPPGTQIDARFAALPIVAGNPATAPRPLFPPRAEDLVPEVPRRRKPE